MAVSVSCGDGPTAPSSSAHLPADFVRFELVTPQEIAPQESVQLRVHAFRADGSFENVTSQATWSARWVSPQAVPSQPVLTVTPQGLATGGDRGRALVSARLGDQTTEATVYVVPKGTFSLVGTVAEDGTAVEGVTVIVIAGTGQNLWARTDVAGAYELYGVAGAVQIRASKEGYADSVQDSDVRAHRSLALELRPHQPWDNFAGTYTLTLAGDRCQGMLPQVRVYTARIDQAGAQLRVSLSGADFRKDGNRFAGTVKPNGDVGFVIRPVSPWDYDGFDFVERLPDGGDLIVGGVITARRTATGLAGNVEPSWDNGLYMRPNSPNGICDAGRFDMEKRPE
jgi:hypothetical protein